MNFPTPLEMTGDTLGCQIKKKSWGLLSSNSTLWVPRKDETWEASSVEKEGGRRLREDRVCGVEMEEMGREGCLEKQLQNEWSLTSAKGSQSPPDGLDN